MYGWIKTTIGTLRGASWKQRVILTYVVSWHCGLLYISDIIKCCMLCSKQRVAHRDIMLVSSYLCHHTCVIILVSSHLYHHTCVTVLVSSYFCQRTCVTVLVSPYLCHRTCVIVLVPSHLYLCDVIVPSLYLDHCCWPLNCPCVVSEGNGREYNVTSKLTWPLARG